LLSHDDAQKAEYTKIVDANRGFAALEAKNIKKTERFVKMEIFVMLCFLYNRLDILLCTIVDKVGKL
jgi:hypothetical protein